mmetsp:Transcript_35859/g.44498  ORF Transcript_35859/g.44498 Transcript_35859/m.44498 type:complete len:108 (+) Transcript_35859:115-438(+)
MIYRRTTGQDAVLNEIFRTYNTANIKSIMEPEGLTEKNHRPDLILSNFQNNEKQVFLDFTTISALSTNAIHNAWKERVDMQRLKRRIASVDRIQMHMMWKPMTTCLW